MRDTTTQLNSLDDGRTPSGRRRRLTKEALAEAAYLSLNMIAKIEAGATGARFTVIERLANALQVDPAELFSTEIPSGAINRRSFNEITTRLALIPEPDLAWVRDLLNAALRPRAEEGMKRVRVPARPAANKASTRRRTRRKSRSSG